MTPFFGGLSSVLLPVLPASHRAAHRRTTSPPPCRRAGRPRSAAEGDKGTERRQKKSEKRSGCNRLGRGARKDGG